MTFLFALLIWEINQWGLASEKDIGHFLDNPAKRMTRLEDASFRLLLGKFD